QLLELALQPRNLLTRAEAAAPFPPFLASARLLTIPNRLVVFLALRLVVLRSGPRDFLFVALAFLFALRALDVDRVHQQPPARTSIGRRCPARHHRAGQRRPCGYSVWHATPFPRQPL